MDELSYYISLRESVHPFDGTICDQISSEWTQFDVSHTELVNFLVESNNEAILNNT